LEGKKKMNNTSLKKVIPALALARLSSYSYGAEQEQSNTIQNDHSSEIKDCDLDLDDSAFLSPELRDTTFTPPADGPYTSDFLRAKHPNDECENRIDGINYGPDGDWEGKPFSELDQDEANNFINITKTRDKDQL
jgi:hypothetical protein